MSYFFRAKTSRFQASLGLKYSIKKPVPTLVKTTWQECKVWTPTPHVTQAHSQIIGRLTFLPLAIPRLLTPNRGAQGYRRSTWLCNQQMTSSNNIDGNEGHFSSDVPAIKKIHTAMFIWNRRWACLWREMRSLWQGKTHLKNAASLLKFLNRCKGI